MSAINDDFQLAETDSLGFSLLKRGFPEVAFKEDDRLICKFDFHLWPSFTEACSFFKEHSTSPSRIYVIVSPDEFEFYTYLGFTHVPNTKLGNLMLFEPVFC